jgi:hypothetical protein
MRALSASMLAILVLVADGRQIRDAIAEFMSRPPTGE